MELPQVCGGVIMSMLVSELMAVNNFGVQAGYPHVSVQDQPSCGSSLLPWQCHHSLALPWANPGRLKTHTVSAQLQGVRPDHLGHLAAPQHRPAAAQLGFRVPMCLPRDGSLSGMGVRPADGSPTGPG